MNNAASRFANSSGKLVYIFNPRKNPKKEKEVRHLGYFLFNIITVGY